MKLKKAISVLLAGIMTLSMATIGMVGTSAAIDPKSGEYVVSEGIEDTQTVYFYMPNEWKNEYTKYYGDCAGAYWWTGSDPCGDVAGTTDGVSWPGYKIHHEMDTDTGSIYSLTMPIDVGQIVFNNFLDGGEDKADPKYTAAIQTQNIACEEYYEPGDSELYDEIYPDEEIYFDGMIYVCDRNKIVENPINQKLTYGGEWYFYYGDGKYGYLKTEDEAVAEGVLQNKCYYSPFNEEPTEPTTVAPTTIPQNIVQPTTCVAYPTLPNNNEYVRSGRTINADIKSFGWGDSVKTVYCHIYSYSGDGQTYTDWQTKAEKCDYNASTGIATYELKTGIDRGAYGLSTIDGTNNWVVMFSANTGAETYTLLFNSSCFGDTVVGTGEMMENTVDSEKSSLGIRYKNSSLTSPKSITSTGKVQGTSFAEGTSNETILGDFMYNYYSYTKMCNADNIKSIISKLGTVNTNEVINYVNEKVDKEYRYGIIDKYEVDVIKNTVYDVLTKATGYYPTDSYPQITELRSTEDGIQISWSAYPGAYAYRVYYKNSDGEWRRFTYDVVGTTKLDTGVEYGRAEVYTIRALDRYGNFISDYNKYGWNTIYGVNAPAITSLKSTENGISISWTPVDGISTYRVYYKTSSGDWKRFANDVKGTTKVDTGVAYGRAETYTVRALDRYGNPISAYKKAGWSTTYGVATPKITSLKSTENGINISWTPIEGVSTYRVYYKTSSGEWKRFANDVKGTTKLDTGVAYGRAETYTVRALDTKGNVISDYNHSGWSTTYGVATPQITSLKSNENGISISWNKIDGVSTYRVYYRTSTGDWKRFANDIKGTTKLDTGVAYGRAEAYTVAALDSKGNVISGHNSSGWSTVYKVATPQITSLTNTNDGIRISWTPVEGVSTYRVYYKTSSGEWKRFANDVKGSTKLDTGVAYGRMETYTVRALDSKGNVISDYNHDGWSIVYDMI